MEDITLSREELYDLFWSKPLGRVSGELQFSVPVLRQFCREQKIPLPWEGYWSTQKSNYPKTRTELPENDVQQKIALPEMLYAAEAALRFPGETENTFRIPVKLTDPDPLIVIAARTLQERDQIYGMDGMYGTLQGQLSLRVSKKNMDRALRIMDTLVKCWRRRGYEISFTDKETKVHVRKVDLRVSLRETVKILPEANRSDFKRYESTGALAFKVDGWLGREWKDSKAPLEDNVAEILDHMEVAVRDLEHFWAENEVRRKNELEKQQAKAAEILSDEKERLAFETLVQEAQRWDQLRVLDSYLNELSRVTKRTPAFEEWLSWARYRRRLFDPVYQRQLTSE